ncbi:MarR family winged helix-turn-helix transcriptional regulator [Mycobacterium paraterrae]|uniref:MarR family transcriptional regulator n=1 Tax=Mycobacterium paraterrae TaxID=577492 RepID=A0ABY3VK36_9MYCO|nr:MarR family transcriptional regulator [Mycobacterium paraterrae]UMB69778.1 MarR family transcriptional regulator [Mycobacterium paraterrae]
MAETEATVPELTELAEGLHRTLSKLFSILRRGDPSAGKEAANDLTLAQLSILVTLLDRGPIRMTDLAAHERVRTPTTTVAIRRLEKIGLVKRSRDPSDLRAVLVDITPRGLAVHRESLSNRITALVSLLSQLNESEIDALTKALAPLERLAASESVTTPAGAANGDATA